MNFRQPEYFINRELSWLAFNERVLEEARDRKNPLFDRIKFLSIVSSNLDEFFMVRVAGLKDQVNVGFGKLDPAGLTPKQQLKNISIKAHKMVYRQYSCFNRALTIGLKKNGIRFVDEKDLTMEQRLFLEEYFMNEVYPVLTPMAVDSSRPFPLILNKSLNIAVLIENREEEKNFMFATVQVPSVLSRMINLPSKDNTTYILLEDVIKMYIDKLFAGHKIMSASPYRITRNADLGIEEEEAEDLLIEIERSLKKRRWGAAIRLEVDKDMDPRLINILKDELEIHHKDIYTIDGPLDLTFLMKIYGLKGYDHLKYSKYISQIPKDLLGKDDFFEVIRERDIFLHHPYESFEPVVGFIEKAAKDPDVLAIKQTLYRVSGDSPIVKALAEAAERGKQVTVLLEVKARFDEENNIQWAKRLEKAGCHVIYGLVGLKTHCKITLVVRREATGIRRYVHLGTGNYNDVTAKFYTDMGIFTADEYYGADASSLFNMLSGYSEPNRWYKLEAAPIGLRKKFIKLIENEIKNVSQGKEGKIIAKMNALVDKEIIIALYKASMAGVKIDLIIRGVCCLRPKTYPISENITVRSIIGKYLEHSRLYYFYNDGDEKVFLSSADWMTRNLDRRVELLFPIEDKRLNKRVTQILKIMLKDTVKARILNNNGAYKKIEKKENALNTQDYFSQMAIEKVKKYEEEKQEPVFEPASSEEQDLKGEKYE
ncbi:MAG: RNA degradosome polyphosphate kinase [Marinisporobacter sp.]|jgi:polyphosphate kinase|nr:RNA degradosome polyphosphate kinase [Marinisporobacter sp.]